MRAIFNTAADGGGARVSSCRAWIAAFRYRLFGAANPVQKKQTVPTAEPVNGKRKEPKDYSGMFLGKRPSAVKKQTYISAALFDKITRIMAVVAHDITLPTFLDNVLEHHLETYRDEINELYELKTKKPL